MATLLIISFEQMYQKFPNIYIFLQFCRWLASLVNGTKPIFSPNNYLNKMSVIMQTVSLVSREFCLGNHNFLQKYIFSNPPSPSPVFSAYPPGKELQVAPKNSQHACYKRNFDDMFFANTKDGATGRYFVSIAKKNCVYIKICR